MKTVKEVGFPGLGSIYDYRELEAIRHLMQECIATNRLISLYSPEFDAFEKKAAEYLGVKHAVIVSSCGTGLDIAAQAVGIQPGDEVITTAITYQATAVCALRFGGVPVPADVSRDSMNLTVEGVEKKITPKTKAIFTMHYGGNPVDIDGMLELASEHGLKIVEDAAHAFGAIYKGKKIGSYDFISVFSFQSGKNISTLGEGGMITCNNDELAGKARQLRAFALGVREGYEEAAATYPVHPLTKDVLDIGGNYRMNAFQAAVGIVQLDKLEELIARRTAYAEKLHALLSEIEGIKLCRLPGKNVRPTHHLFPAMLDTEVVKATREEFLKTLKEEHRVAANLHYPLWYRYKVFQDRGWSWKADCPTAERLVEKELFTLPIHPLFGDEEAEFVAEAIKKTVKTHRHGW